jgi:hypothetical protein
MNQVFEASFQILSIHQNQSFDPFENKMASNLFERIEEDFWSSSILFQELVSKTYVFETNFLVNKI